MGFIGDINRLRKQGKEIDKNFDPGAQAREATERMRALNESMEQANKAMVDGVPGTAQVVTGVATGSVNMNPMMHVDLLVTQEGGMPHPVSVDVVVPLVHLARVFPGATLPVLVSQTDPNVVTIAWDAPAV
jgi:hypothetical protein